MAEPGVTARVWWQVVAGVALLAVLGVVLKVGYDRYAERYTVERRDDGRAVTQVVRATFSRASSLKVGTLSGTVQSTAVDTRGFGMLTSDRVVKAPFSVEYFVDLGGMGLRDYRWDAQARTLIVEAPAVTVGKANVDEAATTLSETHGVFVTRAAAEALAQRVSLAAQRTAQAEAGKPERIAAARENARRALTTLIGGPLRAAGLGDVRVEVTFPDERRGADERWDTTRSLAEVLGNGG